MNNKEIVVALYDDSESNKNIMVRRQAERHAAEIVGDRLITLAPHRAVKRRIYPSVCFDVLQIKATRIEPDPALSDRGRIIAVCEIVDHGERRC